MPSTSLQLCSNVLFACLQGAYWDRLGWKDMKRAFESLPTSLSNYADYWDKQSKTLTEVYSSPHPVCQVPENLSFCYLSQCSFVASCLSDLEAKLQEKNMIEHVIVEDVCSSVPLKKHHYIQTLNTVGLSVTR